LILTGAADLTVLRATDFTGTTPILDASAMTGGLDINLDNNDAMSVKGGSGNDIFRFDDNLSSADTLDGGNGTDRIVVSTDQTTTLSKVSSVEELELQVSRASTDFTINADVITSATNFVVNAVDTSDTGDDAVVVTIDKLEDTDTVTVTKSSSKTGDTDGTDLTLTHATDTSTNAIKLVLSGIGANTSSLANTGIGTITAAAVETINLVSDPSSGGSVTSNGIETLSISAAKSLNITGSAGLTIADVTNTTTLTSIDASAATGKISISGLEASALSFKAGTAQATLSMAGLNATDTIVGGSATNDSVTATGVTGLTATTGKLNVTGVESVIIEGTGANTIDASLMTGLSTLSLYGVTPGNQTITGLAAGVAVGIGREADEFDNGNLVTASLASSTGTSDSLTFKIDNRGGTDTDVDLKTTGIENVTLSVLGTASTTNANDMIVDMTEVTASAVTVSGGVAGAKLDVDVLNAATTSFDASAFLGNIDVEASSATAGVTIKAAAPDSTEFSVIGSGHADTITVGETGAVKPVITGGNGNDTLNLGVKSGFIDTDDISGIEFINLAVKAGDDITIGDNANEVNGIDEATKLTVTGGNELSTLTIGGTTDSLAAGTPTLLTIDASAFSGNVALTYAAEALTSDIVIKGGSLTTDQVTALFDTSTTSRTPQLSGIETLNVYANSGNTNSAETYTLDLQKTSGLSKLALTTSNNKDTTVNVSNYTASTTIQLGTNITTSTDGFANSSILNATLASATGTADALNLKLVDTDNASGTTDINATGVEAVNIEVNDTGTENHKISLAGVTATTSSTQTINVTGGVATHDLTIADIASTARVISASGFVGDLTLSTRGNSAMTITGGSGADDILMQNASDSLTGGAGSDTLSFDSLGSSLASGIFVVDLSSTVDQVTTYNGSSNSAVQLGFENVDFSGLGTATTFGAQVTAASGGSSITGTTATDNITGGAGVDTLKGGTGADVISATTSGDIVVQTSGDSLVSTIISGTTALTGVDVITASTTTGQTLKLDLSSMGNTLADAAVGGITFGNTVMAGTTANDILIMEGTYSGGIFTAVADGTAGNSHTLVQVDTNGITAGGIENILIVGVFDDVASSITNEILTLVV
jgi:hypothetical protein